MGRIEGYTEQIKEAVKVGRLSDQKLSEIEEIILRERMGGSKSIKVLKGEENYRRADEKISEWIENGEPLSVDKIVEINGILNKGINPNGGRLRKEGEEVQSGEIAILRYLTGKDVQPAMNDFVRWYSKAEKTLPPVELAAQAGQRLVSIHPFADGNGRTTALLVNWVLQKQGLPQSILTGDDMAIAVFGGRKILGIEDDSVSASHAVEAVTRGIHRTVDIYQTEGGIELRKEVPECVGAGC